MCWPNMIKGLNDQTNLKRKQIEVGVDQRVPWTCSTFSKIVADPLTRVHFAAHLQYPLILLKSKDLSVCTLNTLN